MSIDRRIWKTGVMAVVATLIFAFVVFRAEDWSRGLNSEFVVYGQTSSGGTGGSTGTGGTITYTKVIPQIAVGSFDGNLTKYSTIIQVINTGTSAVTLTGNFYNETPTSTSAATASTLQMLTTASTVPTFTGSFSGLSLAASGVLVITADTAATYTPLWGKITSTGPITVAAAFELRDGLTNTLYNRVGVAASDGDMRRFVIPRIRNVASGLDTGFAIVNTGSTTANLTATLCCTSTGAAIATKTQAFTPGQKIPTFANGFFNLGTESSGTLYQFMTFESTSGQFGAMGLSIEGASLTSVPVDRLQ